MPGESCVPVRHTHMQLPQTSLTLPQLDRGEASLISDPGTLWAGGSRKREPYLGAAMESCQVKETEESKKRERAVRGLPRGKDSTGREGGQPISDLSPPKCTETQITPGLSHGPDAHPNTRTDTCTQTHTHACTHSPSLTGLTPTPARAQTHI